jgi:hypothetical protein
MNKSVIEMIQDDNPSYNPIEMAREKANIDAEVLDAALDRVYTDGYYGPISPREWEIGVGTNPSSVSVALDILSQVADNVEDYWDSEDEWGCPAVDSRDIVKAAWPFLTEIYGGLPF